MFPSLTFKPIKVIVSSIYIQNKHCVSQPYMRGTSNVHQLYIILVWGYVLALGMFTLTRGMAKKCVVLLPYPPSAWNASLVTNLTLFEGESTSHAKVWFRLTERAARVGILYRLSKQGMNVLEITKVTGPNLVS